MCSNERLLYLILEGGGEEPLMISEVVEGGAAYEDGVLTVSDHCIQIVHCLLFFCCPAWIPTVGDRWSQSQRFSAIRG